MVTIYIATIVMFITTLVRAGDDDVSNYWRIKYFTKCPQFE